MSGFEIKAENCHWRGEHDSDEDLCLHADVSLVIGEEHFQYDCTVSAAALYLLRSLTENHIIGTDNQMLPCCGHSLYANNDLSEVVIVGCSNGIDWSLYHEENMVKMVTESGRETWMLLDEYKDIVYQFADEIERYYEYSLPRVLPDDEIDRNGYIAFWNEWHRRRR